MFKIKSPSHLPNTVLETYLKTSQIPKSTLLKQCDCLVLDFETTGLNHKTQNLVSMGWVEIKNLHIQINSISHIIINPKDKLTEKSVLIHKLTDDELAKGMRIADAMEMLLQKMRGKLLIVHFKAIEQNFINEICKRLYALKKLPMQIIDTLEIERRKPPVFLLRNPEKLRLYNLREKYNLPRYKAHNACIDALATAELFLAQLSWMNEVENIIVKDVL